MSKEVKSAYYGSFFHAPVYGKFEYLEDALIEVDGDGVIVRVVTGDDPCKSDLLEAYRNRGMLVELGEGRFGLPGFVDIHVHAPQWPQAALALDEPLYLWLEQRTFPFNRSNCPMRAAVCHIVSPRPVVFFKSESLCNQVGDYKSSYS